jgi:hypothetical protein
LDTISPGDGPTRAITLKASLTPCTALKRLFVFHAMGEVAKEVNSLRWFKHMSDASDDEKLADVLTEFGPEGYGVWWLLVEVVGRQMDSSPKCEASYSLDLWARKLYVSKRKTTTFLTVFSEKNLVFLEYDNSNAIGKITVKIPKMLNFRDEYSRKSGQPPD